MTDSLTPAGAPAEPLTPAAACAEIKLCYQEFCEKARKLAEKSGVREVLSCLLGEGPVKRAQGELLAETAGALEGRVAGLVGALEPCGPEERSRWAVLALERMILPQPTQDKSLDFMLAALEAQALPLIPLADAAARKELAERYLARTPKRLMFPNQRKVLQALQSKG